MGPSRSPNECERLNMTSQEAGPSAFLPPLEDEPIATLRDPLPLPPYTFDDSLSEDENLLTWVSILARHSSSKKGHMGTIFVRPPDQGDPAQAPSSQCHPPIRDRIVQYANNFPLLYSRLAKAVPEVHAEALAISRCARKGIAVEGCSVYISFPPCNDCFKLLLSAGIQRCVFKKGIPIINAQGEAALVAAEVEGMKLVGTLDEVMRFKAQHDSAGEDEARARDRKRDEERDLRVRGFWADLGEDATRTRSRVARWWNNYNQRYRSAAKLVYGRHGTAPPAEEEDDLQNGEKHNKKNRKKQAVAPQDVAASAVGDAVMAVEAAAEEGHALASLDAARGAESSATVREDDLDELRNAEASSIIPAKRSGLEMN